MRHFLLVLLFCLPALALGQSAVTVRGPSGASGVAAGEWAAGALSANQTTNISVSNPVKFATWTGTLGTDGGTYRVSLEDGKAYLITVTAGAAFSSSSSYVDLQLYDVTNAAAVGPTLEVLPPTANNNSLGSYTITHVEATAGARDIEVRITAVSNLTSLLAAYTRVTVVEVGPSS